VQWAYDYFTHNRGARLITGSPLLPGWGQQAGIRPQVIRAPLDSTSPLLGLRPVPPPVEPAHEAKSREAS
jgi:hypothetical protein